MKKCTTGFKRTRLSPEGAIRVTPTKAEAKLRKTQESKRDDKQPIGKLHADNQSEEDANHRCGKGEKEAETGREKRVNQTLFIYLFI